MTTNEILDTALTLIAVLALVSPVVYLLERTHRRASLDAGGRLAGYPDPTDADARRTRAELRARSAEERPARHTETAPVPKLRGRRHVWVSVPR